ncbi:MAG: hypothetical protein AAB730_00050 [Patescibacteria group bacterium]
MPKDNKEELKFLDVKTRKPFTASEYTIREKSGRFFAVTKAPSGPHEAWRVVSKDFAAKNK